ncbi:zinc finger protein 271-like, partial [Mus musculus]|uniref:zinc finger protein 271-like n=1 Tax=Mus musculus TaxID=10090 RepID=UPI00167BB6DC
GNKPFAGSSGLEYHRIHTAEKPYVFNQCGKAFAGRSDLQRQKIIQKRKSTKASNVIKSLQQALISMYINEHIPERNLLNVTNMVKLFQKPIVFTYIKEYILERNALTLTNVVKLFQKAVINKIIKQHV